MSNSSSFSMPLLFTNKLQKMCGIFCYLLSQNQGSNEDVNQIKEKFSSLLKNRGPDLSSSCVCSDIYFEGHVLWQQGPIATIQPITNQGNVLLFNGDIFSDRPNDLESDSTYLFKELSKLKTIDQICDFVSTIRGPYSFIFLHKATESLFFGRDFLGRNSLLIGLEDDNLYITSVNGKGIRNPVIEIPPLGIFRLDLSTKRYIEIIPWTKSTFEIEFYKNQVDELKIFLNQKFNLDINSCISIEPLWLIKNSINKFGFNEIVKDFVGNLNNSTELFDFLLEIPEVKQVSDVFISLLSNSIRERVTTTPGKCKNCIEPSENCNHPKVGILFSGGVDCSLLAVLAHKNLEKNVQIDLLNVSFEKKNSKLVNWNVPDRISGHEALKELQEIAPDRNWNFVEVNVPRQELENSLKSNISDLVYPLTSILDESLAGALWFAASGKSDTYQSPCRVLIVGSGADELFGGYTRHRTVFQRTGNIEDELLLDWLTLPSRNLARDDRVICDHGITARSPFVEEHFVNFARNLHPLQKCFHGLGEGVGDKLLLRLCAYKLGLKETSVRRKRALQFGSRIADSKQNAKDKSELLK